MNRNINQVTDAFKEYAYGINENESLKKIEEDHHTAWRKGSGETVYFCRRMQLIEFIKRGANLKNVSEDKYAELLENFRVAKHFSLPTLQREIINGKIKTEDI